jgi:hypothetical protein
MTTSSPRTAGHRQPERTTVNLVRTHRNQTEEPVEYSADFGKLFVEDMTRLYLLSYFLTANHEMAERCFVCGFGDCIQGNLMFQKWARSWSRRTIIHNAIRMMSPHPGSTATSATVHLAAEDEPQRIPDQNIAIDSALSLGTSERFVFVLSVLERYPIGIAPCSWAVRETTFAKGGYARSVNSRTSNGEPQRRATIFQAWRE